MSNDRYERIRAALAMGPTPGPWRVLVIISVGSDMGYCSVATTDDTIICDLRDRPSGDAHLIAACDPDTIRALLDERDALAAENARLREAVRPRREDECLTLDHWRIRAYHLEENWSRCSRACAIEQDKREQAEARAKQLAEVLSKILENEASDWKSAEEFGGYVLDDELREEARAALEKENSND